MLNKPMDNCENCRLWIRLSANIGRCVRNDNPTHRNTLCMNHMEMRKHGK